MPIVVERCKRSPIRLAPSQQTRYVCGSATRPPLQQTPSMLTATTLYLLRHGDVENPEGIVYGSLPGYGLSETGRAEILSVAEVLADRKPFDILYASPLERAQQSAATIAQHLGLTIVTDDRITEIELGDYQGCPFADLPSPYLTEDGVPGIESASSMRARMGAWLKSARKHARVVAVSHRDTIALLLLDWMGLSLSDLGDLDIPTGSVHEVRLDGDKVEVVGPAVG